MSVATELRSAVRTISGGGAAFGRSGNGVKVLEDTKRKKEGLKKPSGLASERSKVVVRSNVSSDGLWSSDSSSGGSSVKNVSSKRRVKRSGPKSGRVVPDGFQPAHTSPSQSGRIHRCDWITPNSEPLYISFHDEEWGFPVHDDRKLFELLILSQALSEFTWPAILNKREVFRKLFDNFDPSSISKFEEKKLLSLKVNGATLLSEPKLRAVVENANQMLKIQQEFGSFSSYCWKFVNQKPIRNSFRYARQVPAKTPKAELMSKDLMQRGFRCVGPTVVYSFMQVAGLVNDHLITCFRYQECNSHSHVKKELKPQMEELNGPTTKPVENTLITHDQTG